MAGKHTKAYNENDVPKAVKNMKRNENGSSVPNKNEKTKKKRKGLKVFGIIVLILIILFVGIVGGTYWYIQDKFGKMQQVDIDEETLNISSEVEKSLSGYRNIAIFGVDSRDSNLGKGNRSDCIIIASINNNTKDVKLISVYRDTYVKIDGYGLDKITHAYSYGSAQLAINTLNTNLDLNIKEFVTVNWDAVVDAVDKLGGITINIEAYELNAVNAAISETATATGSSNKKIPSAGKQTLNGVQTVAYSRTRYTEGGDYKRTERMRDVIMAMVDKLKTKNIGEINSFIDEILPKVYTNISAGDIIALIPDAMNFKITESIGWPYETKGITLDRWYGVPVTLESNVIKLHQEAFEEPEYTPTDTVKDISNSIIKKTGYR